MSIEIIKNPHGKIKEYDIVNVIQRLGVTSNLNGFQYIKTGVEILMSSDSYTSTISITKLYHEIGKLYSITPANVERCIRHAIQVSMGRVSHEFYKEVFVVDYDAECVPTNNEYISTLATYLRYHYVS